MLLDLSMVGMIYSGLFMLSGYVIYAMRSDNPDCDDPPSVGVSMFDFVLTALTKPLFFLPILAIGWWLNNQFNYKKRSY